MHTDRQPLANEPSLELSWASIDRRDWHLWLLSFLLIIVLGIGLLIFMFPLSFWERDAILQSPDRPFYGLSLLLVLTLAYLHQKESRLRELKRKQWEARLVHVAFHDPLTDLPNRALFVDRLEQCVSRAKRHPDYLFAVLYMDLDRFKIINDSMGHAVGDQLLMQVGKRLRLALRNTDTVSRLGGDEFAILMDDIKHNGDVNRAIERVRSQFLSPMNLGGREVFTSASMGIALSSAGYQDAEDLLRDAETAMYRAKALGEGRHEVFDKSMHEEAVRLLKIETDLRRAIERNELWLHYQPIMSLHTGLLAGFEALVRWQHPNMGLLSPMEFIPVAEQSQLIVLLTQWVLGEACSQARIWKSQMPADFTFHISVNLPASYLARRDMLEEISNLLAENELPPEYLRLEITESEIIGDPASISKALSLSNKFGVKVSIDDFGTGYSSLSYLADLPVHALKIDRAFVSKLDDERNSAIVRSVVSLAHNLGLQVIAEGVETPQQLDYLKTLKCQYGQGYFFSPPCDSKQATEFLTAWSGIGDVKKMEIANLRAFELFRGLEDDPLAEVAGVCEDLIVASGSIIIRQEQVGDKVYLLLEGTAGVYRGQSDPPRFLAVLQAPAVFGEMAVVSEGHIRTANVKALSNLRLLTIPIPLLEPLLRRFPRLGQNLQNLVAERMAG
ncbi:MAG TPA: EAL domain-containing protein [Terriglobia bacterium]|nr:EAL domain-containing protein [Terriglobia bacterium]